MIFHSYVRLPEGIHRYSTVPLGYSIMIPIWIVVLGDPIFVWYQTCVYVRIPLYPRISPTVSPWWLVLHLTFSLVKYHKISISPCFTNQRLLLYPFVDDFSIFSYVPWLPWSFQFFWSKLLKNGGMMINSINPWSSGCICPIYAYI